MNFVLRGRGSSPQTRNHYRSVLRGLYRTALLPAYRVESGVTLNPFRDVPREALPNYGDRYRAGQAISTAFANWAKPKP